MNTPPERVPHQAGEVVTVTRFAKLTRSLAGRKGVHDPKALAAFIGRKKYGAKGMAAKAAAGRRKAK